MQVAVHRYAWCVNPCGPSLYHSFLGIVDADDAGSGVATGPAAPATSIVVVYSCAMEASVAGSFDGGAGLGVGVGTLSVPAAAREFGPEAEVCDPVLGFFSA